MREIRALIKLRYKLFFAIVIAFAVVSFWRGVWGLMDVYLFPNNQVLSFWISFAVGIFILVVTDYAIKELM